MARAHGVKQYELYTEQWYGESPIYAAGNYIAPGDPLPVLRSIPPATEQFTIVLFLNGCEHVPLNALCNELETFAVHVGRYLLPDFIDSVNDSAILLHGRHPDRVGEIVMEHFVEQVMSKLGTTTEDERAQLMDQMMSMIGSRTASDMDTLLMTLRAQTAKQDEPNA